MFKFLNNKLTFRKGFIIGVILLIISNILFITCYYKFILSNEIYDNYNEITEELNKELHSILTIIENENKDFSYLENYAKEKDVIITITDEFNNNIAEYNKGKRDSNQNILVSNIIKLKDKYYLISVSKKIRLFTLKLGLNFLLYESIIILILTIIGLFGANLKILQPITSLSKDVNNYKIGILPKKRKIKGAIDIIQNDFVDLVNKLESEKEKQNQIIASISHDIKTPLTSILGYSERLLTSNLSNENKTKYANTIYNKSINMKELIEEFDNYLSANIKDETKYEKISIKHLCEYLNNYYKDDLKEKNIDLKIKNNCPNSYIYVDFSKFKRIFSNIITNSIRYLNKEKKIINITIKELNNVIEFNMSDNGTGTKEDLNKIFEPLFTTDKSRKISGLGLAICKEIIESLGGNIKAENNKMGGLSIIFTIDKFKECNNEGTDTI